MTSSLSSPGPHLNVLDIVIAASRDSTALASCLEALEAELLEPKTPGARPESRAYVRGVTLTIAIAASQRIGIRHHSFVNWLDCPDGATLPELWGAGLSSTTGEFVAILDADCPVATGWLATALANLPVITAGVGFGCGAVRPRGLRSAAAWAAYFCDYGWFVPPLPSGEPRSVAGNNLIVRRDTFSAAPEFAGRQFWKAHLIDRLRAQGMSGISLPELTIWYQKDFRARGWLRRRYRHARCYAGMRMTNSGWAARLTRGLLTPLLPAVFCWRLVREVWPRNRHRAELLRASGWIAMGFIVWAMGEWRGYWFGPGNTCRDVV